MPRIETLNRSAAPAASQAILDAVQKKLGMTPNLLKTFAHSPAVLRFYLNQSEALGGGFLAAALREQIALAVAGANQCDYCASAHTLLAKGAGVKEAELASNLAGYSSDAKTQAALDFAKAIVHARGHVSDEQLQNVRNAGYSEAEVVEIIAHVAMNLFTNYFNHIAATVIDFPQASTAEAA